MRRVSSRQRLVSWDAFDAMAADDLSLQDYETCSLVTLDIASNNKRKRRVKQEPSDASTHSTLSTLASSLGEVHPVAALPWEFAASYHQSDDTPSSASELSSLMDDAQLHILSFLNVQDVRHIMKVNRDQHSLIVSDEAEPLWQDLAHQEWTWMRNSTTMPTTTLLQDDLHDNTSSNLNMLLSLACPTPSQVDESIFTPPPRTLRSGRVVPRPALLKTVQAENGYAAVQFVGPIGQDNRCIRANVPMPRPKLLQAKSKPSRRGLMSRLRRKRCHGVSTSSSTWRPFVAPFCLKDSVMNMTPRLVSYYEVSILQAPTPAATSNTSVRPSPSTTLSECVAVGLALPDFSLHKCMPGWDSFSYGYHGDDGGIFHAKGQMLKQYGPSFGVGDIIGCGIDYHQRAIFFTRNGEFLGYAFEDLDTTLLTRDLYPVVGTDTNHLIQCNFGTDRPFSFDLQSYMEKQKDVVLGSLH